MTFDSKQFRNLQPPPSSPSDYWAWATVGEGGCRFSGRPTAGCPLVAKKVEDPLGMRHVIKPPFFWNDPRLTFLAPANRLWRQQECAEMAPNRSDNCQEHSPREFARRTITYVGRCRRSRFVRRTRGAFSASATCANQLRSDRT